MFHLNYTDKWLIACELKQVIKFDLKEVSLENSKEFVLIETQKKIHERAISNLECSDKYVVIQDLSLQLFLYRIDLSDVATLKCKLV